MQSRRKRLGAAPLSAAQIARLIDVRAHRLAKVDGFDVERARLWAVASVESDIEMYYRARAALVSESA